MRKLISRVFSKLLYLSNKRRCLQLVRRWQAYFIGDLTRVLNECVKNNDLPIASSDLNESDKSSIKSVWQQAVGTAPNEIFYRLLKCVHATTPSPRYVPDDLYYSHILPFLNPIDQCLVLEDKSKYGFWFKEEPRPIELVRRIRGGDRGVL